MQRSKKFLVFVCILTSLFLFSTYAFAGNGKVTNFGIGMHPPLISDIVGDIHPPSISDIVGDIHPPSITLIVDIRPPSISDIVGDIHPPSITDTIWWNPQPKKQSDSPLKLQTSGSSKKD